MDFTKACLSFILLWTNTQYCNSARILGIFPVPFREHQVIFHPLIENLVNRGHEMVLLTTDPLHQSLDNITQIDLSFTYKLKILDNLKDTTLSGSEMLQTIFETMRQISNSELKSDAIQNLLQDKTQKFDAVIVEWSGASVMNAFAHKYNVPLIGISTGGALINSDEAFGNPSHPIAYPNVLLPFSEELNLIQRIASVVFTIWYRYLYFTEELPRQNALAKQYFGDDLPDLWDIERAADLLLVNSYSSLGNVRPTVPTTVFLGGIHSNPTNTIPRDLGIFLNTSNNGAIYINIGTMQSSGVSERRLEMLLYAAEKLKLDILWNCDIRLSINTSVRIYYTPDIYQEDILAHPKIVAFMTNGGQRNIEDAIHNEVPVLGISLSTNIEHYLRQIEKYQAGIVSLIDFESEDKFTEQMKSVIENSMYTTNIQKLNKLITDKPMSSMDTAIWWIEYTIRNKGTSHLQSPMKQITWFKYLLLDVLLSITMVITTTIFIVIYIIHRMVKYSKSLPFEMVTRGSKCKVL